MGRRRSKILSERELEVMNVVWDLGKATVREVHETLGGDREAAYTSIATMMKFLEDKGMLRHRKMGRTYYYHPAITREEIQANAIRYILSAFFHNNHEQFIHTYINVNGLSPDIGRRVEKLFHSS